MEKVVDSVLESMLGGAGPMINAAAGAAALVAGIVLLASAKKQASRGRRKAGLICIGVGCLGVMSCVVQLSIR